MNDRKIIGLPFLGVPAEPKFGDDETPDFQNPDKQEGTNSFFKFTEESIKKVFNDASTITLVTEHIYQIYVEKLNLRFKMNDTIGYDAFRSLLWLLRDVHYSKTKEAPTTHMNNLLHEFESIYSADVFKHKSSDAITFVIIFQEPLTTGGNRCTRKLVISVNNFKNISYDYAIKNELISITPEELLDLHNKLIGRTYLNKIKEYAMIYALITESISEHFEEKDLYVSFNFIVPDGALQTNYCLDINNVLAYAGFYHARIDTDVVEDYDAHDDDDYSGNQSVDSPVALTDDIVDFSGIYGLDTIKSELRLLGESLKYKYSHKESNLEIPKGVLLVGAPGTGKTFITKAFSQEYKIELIYLSDYVNNTAIDSSSITRCFRNACQMSKFNPMIIFIDEIDKIITNQNSQVMATLLEYLSMNGNFLVIGACNSDDAFPEALTRPGRFDKKMYFGELSSEAKVTIFKQILKKKEIDYTNIDVVSVIDYLPKDITVATLDALAKQARIIKTVQKEEIDTLKIINIAETLIEGISESITLNKETMMRTAWHEAGHATIGLLAGKKITFATIKPSYKYGGCVLFRSKEDTVAIYDDYVKQIEIFIGGWAAEKIIFKDLSVGAGYDMRIMQRLINFLTTSCGDSGTHLISTDQTLNINYSSEERNETYKVKKSKTQKYVKNSLRTLKKHRVLLNRIYDVLIAKERVSGEELDGIYKNYLAGTKKKI